MKKVLALVLSFVLLFALAIPAFAEGEAKLVTTASATTLKRGDEVKLTFSLDKAATLITIGLAFDQAVDADVFSVSSGAWSTSMKTPAVFPDDHPEKAGEEEMIIQNVKKNDGTAAYTCELPREVSGEIFALTLKVKDDAAFGDYSIKILVSDTSTIVPEVVPVTLTVTHDCVLDTEYSKDDDGHWYACTVEGCVAEPVKTPHVWDNACDTECNDCKHTRTITHAFDKANSDAENHWIECSVCATKDEESIEAHTFTEVVDAKFLAAAANCQSPAKYYKSCDCGAKSTETFENGEKDATVHAETEVKDAVAATCTKEGYSGDTYCKACKEKLAEGKKIDKTEHTYGEWVVVKEATATEEGSKERTCTACKEAKETAKIDKIPAAPGVNTGDASDMVLWTVLALVSIVAISAVVYFKKREGNRA